ncbi:hypothetical protein DCC79_02410 [bacterium]|nr:phospholipid carrier-dependent glycosyltransferase [Chloroflexi bacterium CFX6]RIL12171.1 MAG: hypothetical protein DCC79_02410 [bacterium]
MEHTAAPSVPPAGANGSPPSETGGMQPEDAGAAARDAGAPPADAAPDPTESGSPAGPSPSPETTGAAYALLALALTATGQLFLARDRAMALGLFDYLAGALCIAALAWSAKARDLPALVRSMAARETPPGARGWREALGGLAVEPLVLARRWVVAVAASPLRAAAVAVSLTLAVSIYAVLVLRADGPVSYWDVFGLWLASIGLYLAAMGWGERVVRPNWWRQALRRHRTALLDVAALLALALTLRVWRLGTLPDIIDGDEGMIGDIGRDLAVTATGNIFGSAWGHGNLYYYLVSVPYAWLDDAVLALRLPSALGGALAVPATYLVARQLFGRRVGMLAGFLLAVSHAHIHFSRIAFCHGCDSLTAMVAMFGLLRGLDRRDAGWMAVSGVALGLAQYGYVGGRLIDVVVAVYLVAIALIDPGYLRSRLGLVAASFGAALVTAAPILYWARYRTGDYMSRLGMVGLVQHRAELGEPPPDLAVLATQLRDAFLALGTYPVDMYYSARIPMLDAVSATLLVLGLAVALTRWRGLRPLLPVLHVVGAVAALALVLLPNASAYRITGVLASCAILVTLAMVVLADGGLRGLGLGARAPWVATTIAALGIGAYNVNYYFRDHLVNCRYGDPRSASAALVGRLFRDRGGTDTAFAATEPDFALAPFLNQVFLSNREPRDLATLPPEVPRPGAPGSSGFVYTVPGDTLDLAAAIGDVRPAWVVVGPANAAKLDALAAAAPGGERVELARCGTVLVEAYRVP